MKTLTKQHIAEVMRAKIKAKGYNLPTLEAIDVIDCYCDYIYYAVATGHRIKISKGINYWLLARHESERPARNPKTGEPAVVPARRVPIFIRRPHNYKTIKVNHSDIAKELVKFCISSLVVTHYRTMFGKDCPAKVMSEAVVESISDAMTQVKKGEASCIQMRGFLLFDHVKPKSINAADPRTGGRVQTISKVTFKYRPPKRFVKYLTNRANSYN